jgi:peptide chain release factor 2
MQRIRELDAQAAATDFWDEPRSAQAINQELTVLNDQVGRWKRVEQDIAELQELDALAEGDPDLAAEIDRQSQEASRRLDSMEFDLLLGGKYDTHNAIVEFSAGAGGIEAQDWAEMLLRMYLRWGQTHGFETELVDQQAGEEAGIKSATLIVRGAYAYGYLSAERGTHRLVRLSPFDSARRRHTSFALVQVMPEVQQDLEIQIDLSEVRVDTYRSTGAGGQNVNKTDSAVRLTHLPTGIVVTCQNERSQLQNREVALNILRSRLLERRIQEQEAEAARLRGQYVAADFGSQIRNYVMHPYTLVKDLRSGFETSNVQAVLNGELDACMEAFLRWHVGRNSDTAVSLPM